MIAIHTELLLIAALHTPYQMYSGLSLRSVYNAVQRLSNVISSPLSIFAFVSCVLKPSCPFQCLKLFSHVLFEHLMVSGLILKSDELWVGLCYIERYRSNFFCTWISNFLAPSLENIVLALLHVLGSLFFEDQWL